MSHTKLLLALLTLSTVALSNGCKSSTEPGASNNQPNTTAKPGVGSWFAYRFEERDTLNVVTKSSIDTIYVIASGITYNGKTNVVQTRRGSDPSNASFGYIQYDANGDIEFYSQASGPGERSGWLVAPIASKGERTLVTYDSTSTYPSGPLHVTITDTYTYAGDETVGAAGENLACQVLQYQRLYQDGYHDYTSTEDYSSKLHFLVRQRVVAAHPSNWKTDTFELIAYSLK